MIQNLFYQMLISSLQTGKDWQTPQSGRGRYVAFRFYEHQIFPFLIIGGYISLDLHSSLLILSYEVHLRTRNLEKGKIRFLLYPATSICVT